MSRLWLLCLLSFSALEAAELRSVAIDRVDGHYKLTSRVWFDANIDALYAVLVDYDFATAFSSFIVESRNLEADANGQRGFYIRNQGCVWFFCASFERTGRVETEALTFIRSTADPEASDFRFSLEEWRFEVDGDGTLVAYDFEFEPKFWIPPLIGPYVLQKKLETDSVRAIHRIEAIAQGLKE